MIQKKYKKEYPFDVLKDRKHFEIEAENEEFLHRLMIIYYAWNSIPQS